MVLLNLLRIKEHKVSEPMVEVQLPVTTHTVVVAALDVRYGPSVASELLMPVVISPEITGCVNALFDVLTVGGYQPRLGRSRTALSSERAYQSTLQHWQRCSNEIGGIDGWMKFVKYKTASYFFSHTKQKDLPPPVPSGLVRDNPGLIASGTAGRFANHLLDSKKRWWLLNSILQLKKGCPRPKKELVEKQIKSTVQALTTERKVDTTKTFIMPWADVDEVKLKDRIENVLSRETAIQQLKRTVDELFHNKLYTDKDRYSPYFPSTSASFDDSIKQGGSFRTIRNLVEEFNLHTNKVEVKEESKYGEVKSTVTRTDSDGPSLVRYSIVRGEEYIGAPRYEYRADVTDLEHRFGDLFERTKTQAFHEIPYVKPIGLAESLKVRVITKGPPKTSFVLKPIQKFMWKALRSHPTFKLIGQPVDIRYLQDRLGANLPEQHYYLSGDYSAATDNLAPWVSEAIATRIAAHAGFDGVETSLLLRALTQHFVLDDNGNFHRQTWGQLMGSVVSFPILCIANAAFCRWALELSENRVMTLSQTTLMVNGDDCACRITIPGVEYWKKITTFCGLTPSIGKFFVSKEFVNINSTNFERLDEPVMKQLEGDEKSRPINFNESQYLNLGLLYGLKRSGELVAAHDLADQQITLGARCRDLIAHSPEDMKVDVFKLFKAHHSKLLNDVKVPYFVPESWGGLGLPIIHDANYSIAYGPSDVDLRLAHAIKSAPEDYKVGKPPLTTFWNVHKYIISHMPFVADTGLPNTGKAYDRLYGLMAVDALFASGNPFSEKKNVYERSVLRQNEKSWLKVQKNCMKKLPPPLSIATLLSSEPSVAQPDYIISSLYDNH